jgi:hypothetical protein
MEMIMDNIDLTLLGTETDVNLPWQYHNVIAMGMGWWIYQSKGMLTESNKAYTDFKIKKDELVSELQDRDSSTPLQFLPSLTNIE